MPKTRRFIIWVIVLALILLIILAMQFTDEVQWDEALAYSLILLALGGVYELWQWLKKHGRTYRFAFGVGIVGMLLLGWISGAVGIIDSENNPANLMYWAVPAVGLVGALLSRFKPRGMALSLLVTAFVQFSVPLIALFVWPAQASWGEAGVIGVFILNTILAALFFASACLFQKASSSLYR